MVVNTGMDLVVGLANVIRPKVDDWRERNCVTNFRIDHFLESLWNDP